MPRRFLVLLALCSSSAFAASCFARGQVWNFLGYTQISAAQDHARIQISRPDRLFRSIQLKVTGDAVFFDHLVVHFAGGASQEFLINGRLSSAVTDYVVDAPGQDRPIESVELWYYKQPWGRNPRVTLYGNRELQTGAQSPVLPK